MKPGQKKHLSAAEAALLERVVLRNAGRQREEVIREFRSLTGRTVSSTTVESYQDRLGCSPDEADTVDRFEELTTHPDPPEAAEVRSRADAEFRRRAAELAEPRGGGAIRHEFERRAWCEWKLMRRGRPFRDAG